MTYDDLPDLTLADLGWSQSFLAQLALDDFDTLTPARVAQVHRDRVTALSENGPHDLRLPDDLETGEVAVGDWLMADLDSGAATHVLDRKTLLARGAEAHEKTRQLIAANLDTLFITTSCNADFNPARLERYLSLAHEAGVVPVIVLTKVDQADDPDSYSDQARALGRGLEVLTVNSKAADVARHFAPWCGQGQTVALVGSSGVGKTTLANALTGGTAETQDIRADDAKGRHTTTARSLHRITGGGWLIDTPGVRGLGMAETADGIATTFAEITEAAEHCKFRDCAHDGEPGCAVAAGIAAGEIAPERLERYRKLIREDAYATETIAQMRDRTRKLGKMYRNAQNRKKR